MNATSMESDQAGAPKLAGFGAVLAFAGVLLGAFGAHGLRERLDPAHLQIFETAARYHLIHAVALVAIGLSSAARSRALIVPGTLLIVGIVLFSGSLYALALGAPTWTGAITPLGGLSFMAGWLALALAMMRTRS